MEIKFKKFTITENGRCFVLKFSDRKGEKNWYYADFESLIEALPNKIILKSESKTVKELTDEIQRFKNLLRKKTWQ